MTRIQSIREQVTTTEIVAGFLAAPGAGMMIASHFIITTKLTAFITGLAYMVAAGACVALAVSASRRDNTAWAVSYWVIAVGLVGSSSFIFYLTSFRW